jgi:hypothetical protein
MATILVSENGNIPLTRYERTNSRQQTGNRSVIGIASGLVLSQDTTTDTLHNADLGRLLVFQLSQTEGECAKLLDDLGQSLSGAGSLEDVGGSRAAMQGSAERQGLDLSGAKGEANFNTPDFPDLGDTFALHARARGKDDLLGTLDLVALKQPAGGVLNHITVVSLGYLFDEGGDLALSRGLLGGSLLLLLLGTASQKTGGHHESQQKLVCVVSGVDEVSLATSHNILGRFLVGNDDHVANNGTESIDLSAELDLDDLAGLEGGLSLLSVRHQGSVRRHIGAWGDSCRVTDTFFVKHIMSTSYVDLNAGNPAPW